MSKLAFHVDHMQAGEVGAIDRHHRRLGDNHGNELIVPERSSWNIFVLEPEAGLWSTVKKKVAAVQAAGNRVTKSSIVCSEWVIYPPEDLQDPVAADRERLRSWASDVLAWMREEGLAPEQAVIHLDETTVHMHVDGVPLTKDGRLCRKEIYARSNLSRYHTELAAYLAERGWDIQRGESTKGKGVKSKSPKEYKRQQEQKVKALEERAEALTEALKPAEAFLDIKPKETIGGAVKLSKEDYAALKLNAEAAHVMKSNADHWRQQYEQERQRSEQYKKVAQLTISERLERAEYERLKGSLDKLEQRLALMEKKVGFADKLIAYLPRFLADKLMLKELEKASGFRFKDYWDLAEGLQGLREDVARRAEQQRQ